MILDETAMVADQICHIAENAPQRTRQGVAPGGIHHGVVCQPETHRWSPPSPPAPLPGGRPYGWIHVVWNPDGRRGPAHSTCE